MEALDRLGLTGPYQVHDAPAVLALDRRAHQVFRGFAGTDTIREALGADAELLEAGDGVLICPAWQEPHPGGFYGLAWVVKELFGPDGCPWDKAQTHESLKRHLLEEAYELFDAVDAEDFDAMAEELGDVLLQPLMQAQVRAEAGGWTIEEPIRLITEKLIRRHPHVFGDSSAQTEREVLRQWDAIKKSEKKARSALGDIPASAPSLTRAEILSRRAARQGFDWPSLEAVWEKVHEEIEEVRQAEGHAEIESEIGDLLFAVVQAARWQGIDPELALQAMTRRFQRRFELMEDKADKPLNDLSAQEWDDLWVAAKSSMSSVEQENP